MTTPAIEVAGVSKRFRLFREKPTSVKQRLLSGRMRAEDFWALRDVTIDGVPIPAGSKLLMVVHSGNRDARHFADPDFFDIRRSNVIDHLSFGYGAHQCLGKNIARMELQVMIGQLARRRGQLLGRQ